MSCLCTELRYPPLQFTYASVYLPCAAREAPTIRIDASNRSIIRCILLVTSFTIHFPSHFINQRTFSISLSPFCIRNCTSLRHRLRVLSTATVNVVIYVLVCYSKLLHVSSLRLSHVCIFHKVLSGSFNR